MQFLIVYWLFFLHPFHVSVYEVVYNEESKAIQITARIFLDDLEKALRAENGSESLTIDTDSLLSHTTNKLMFQNNFKLTVNHQPAPYNYLGGEMEQNVMWVYLEVEKVDSVKSIKLTNKMLLNIYDDQQNMIHFRIMGKTRSFILDGSNTTAVFEL